MITNILTIFSLCGYHYGSGNVGYLIPADGASLLGRVLRQWILGELTGEGALIDDQETDLGNEDGMSCNLSLLLTSISKMKNVGEEEMGAIAVNYFATLFNTSSPPYIPEVLQSVQTADADLPLVEYQVSTLLITVDTVDALGNLLPFTVTNKSITAAGRWSLVPGSQQFYGLTLPDRLALPTNFTIATKEEGQRRKREGRMVVDIGERTKEEREEWWRRGRLWFVDGDVTGGGGRRVCRERGRCGEMGVAGQAREIMRKIAMQIFGLRCRGE
ncbi:hypothetical protein RIF29_37755 [Crotalaria pallida]|uniref:Uncharacterized protein n=1 Tax=Crotalaria pallida TaxID=3830 RepID=A0AAN9HRP0_CROPI